MSTLTEHLHRLQALESEGLLTEAEHTAFKRAVVSEHGRTLIEGADDGILQQMQHLEEFAALRRAQALSDEEFDELKQALFVRMERDKKKDVPHDQVGPYTPLEFLGHGGMGSVFRARHVDAAVATGQGGDVALKVLHPHLVENARFVERFEREARLGARLRHPALVEVLEWSVARPSPWIAMRLITGVDLEAWMGSSGRPVAAVVSKLRPLAEALDYLHKEGIVHRDLKPDNIQLTESGEPVLLDLGIARILDGSTRLTQTAATMGTWDWMAPEQLDARSVGPEADRYALGLIAYRALAGRLPWEETLDVRMVMPLKARGELQPLATVASVPEHVSQAVMQALASEPRERPASCAALIDAMASPQPRKHAATLREDEPKPATAVEWGLAPTMAPVPERKREKTVLEAAGEPGTTPVEAKERRSWGCLPVGAALIGLVLVVTALGGVVVVATWAYTSSLAEESPTRNTSSSKKRPKKRKSKERKKKPSAPPRVEPEDETPTIGNGDLMEEDDMADESADPTNDALSSYRSLLSAYNSADYSRLARHVSPQLECYYKGSLDRASYLDGMRKARARYTELRMNRHRVVSASETRVEFIDIGQDRSARGGWTPRTKRIVMRNNGARGWQLTGEVGFQTHNPCVGWVPPPPPEFFE